MVLRSNCSIRSCLSKAGIGNTSTTLLYRWYFTKLVLSVTKKSFFWKDPNISHLAMMTLLLWSVTSQIYLNRYIFTIWWKHQITKFSKYKVRNDLLKAIFCVKMSPKKFFIGRSKSMSVKDYTHADNSLPCYIFGAVSLHWIFLKPLNIW